MKNSNRTGFYFKKYEKPYQTPFEKLFDVFKELIVHTSGDFDEAIDWLRELDNKYKLSTEDYTIEDFIAKGRDLEKIVLSRAVKLHIERKTMVLNNKTVIFS